MWVPGCGLTYVGLSIHDGFPIYGYCNREHDDKLSDSWPKTRLLWLWIVKETSFETWSTGKIVLSSTKSVVSMDKFLLLPKTITFGCRHWVAKKKHIMFEQSIFMWVNGSQPNRTIILSLVVLGCLPSGCPQLCDLSWFTTLEMVHTVVLFRCLPHFMGLKTTDRLDRFGGVYGMEMTSIPSMYMYIDR